MGEYIYPEIDFVFRTQQLLKQYSLIERNYQNIKNYNITLFLNCFVGLLIIPQQESLNSLSNMELVDGETNYGIKPIDILVIKNGRLIDEVKSFRNVAKHMRNSIAHNHFKTICNKENKNIDSIEFRDYPPDKYNPENPEEYLTFKLKIGIEDLKLFIEMISNLYLNEMAKKNKYKDFEDFRKDNKSKYHDIHDIHIH